ncbi:MAG: glutathione S-transferase [Fischerella sp. CENA71]|nr:glutathione S-transferase [Fischerella sp. CENA71]
MKKNIESPTKPFYLITIPISHYCEKARWALDKLKITYVEKRHTPPFHLLATNRVGGKTTPVLVTESGIFIDSSDILKYLDSIVSSDAKLYPTNQNQRQEIEKLEDLFNSQLGPATRRWGYFHIMNDYKIMQSRWCHGVPFFEQAFFPILFPITRSLAQRKLNINPESAAQAYDTIQSIFEQVNKLLSDGRTYLVGDKFSAADLTFATLAAPAVLPPEHPMQGVSYKELPPKLISKIKEFRKTPAGKFVLRLYRDRNS